MQLLNRARVRQDLTAPLMADLYTKLTDPLAKISSQSTLAKAIQYSLDRWKGLTCS